MSNPNSPNLDEVIGNVVKDILQERVEEVQREMAEKESQENTLVVVPKEIKVVVEEGEARAFYSNKGEEAFQKHLAKKSVVEETRFKELVSPFKKYVQRRGWEQLSQHRELGVWALVKEFYVNLGKLKNLTSYVMGRWIPFGERAIS